MFGLSRHGAVFVLVAVAVFGLGFFSTLSGLVSIPSVAVMWEERPDVAYRPSNRVTNGPELALIYIGSSGCADSNKEGLPQVINQLKLLVGNRAAEQGRGFVAIGLSIDWSVAEGVRHLSKSGPLMKS